jgi:hypothetical protein
MVDAPRDLAKKIGPALVTGLTLLCLALPTATSAADQGQRLNILTSFSPEFYNPFIQTYQSRNPEL